MNTQRHTNRRVRRVFVISAHYYPAMDLVEKLEKALSDRVPVVPIFRTYHLPDLKRGDIIITDGTCKDANEYGQSQGVYVSYRFAALKARATYLFSPTFFGPFASLLVFRLKLRLLLTGKKKALA